jgi:hypothetical protein
MSTSDGPGEPDGIVVVRFGVTDVAYPFVGVSQEESCRVELEKILPRGSDRFAEYFKIVGADPDRVLELAEANDLVEPRVITRYEDGGLFEFIVTGFCPAQDLIALGAVPQKVVAEDGVGYIVAEVPDGESDADIINAFLDQHPSASLKEKETKDRQTPLFTQEELQLAVEERLTDRQQEVLLTAYDSGYYEWPKETTGEELAESLDISAPTLSEHLQAAERKVVSILAEDVI